jgi:hypothetical protein
MYYFSQASRELKTAVIWFGAWTQNCSNLVWCFCRRLCRWWAEGDEEQANVELAGSRSSSLVYTLSFGPLRESVKIRGCRTAGEREEGSCVRWGRGCHASRRRRAKWAEESESNLSEAMTTAPYSFYSSCAPSPILGAGAPAASTGGAQPTETYTAISTSNVVHWVQRLWLLEKRRRRWP